MMERIKIYDTNFISACYFRSTADAEHKKVIIQLTERCNMFCKHCFVSSSSKGKDLSFDDLKNKIIPKLLKGNVTKITLTGGEPLVHPEIEAILRLLAEKGFSVAICTNGLRIDREFIDKCYHFGNIHFNISLDGFRTESHGKFRGIENPKTFDRILENISAVGQSGMLNGILVTPNMYAQLDEYGQICCFAKRVGAKYVLFNPLSEFGRGQDTKSIGYYNDELLKIKESTQQYNDNEFEVVYIRFPDSSKEIGSCPVGKILYIFTDGSIAICPYLVFAAHDKVSLYQPSQFYISNALDEDCDISCDLSNYKLPMEEPVKARCSQGDNCTRGCLAAKVSKGLSIYDCDVEICPRKFGES